MLATLIQEFITRPQNQKGTDIYFHSESPITFELQSATYQISYMTFLANGNRTGLGIYPAVYYYRMQKKIFVVYGQSQNMPRITWDAYIQEPVQIREHFLPQEVAELERTKYNYLNNFTKAVFELPEGDVNQADFEAIASALGEVILEYAAIFKTLTEANCEFPLTEEQKAIVTARGNVVKVNAFAGTGKTSTLAAFAKDRFHKKILYLAFNKAICENAPGKFTQNVMPRTAHAMAYHELKDQYRLHARSYRPTEIAKFLEIDDINLAQQVNTFLTYFFNSAELEITEELLGQFTAQPNRDKVAEDVAKQLVSLADGLFSMMKKKKVKGTFDFFLKMYQLGNPQLPYDVILFDEAQDASPVMLDIVFNQKNAQKVFVGDRHQQIYSFRYAINALDNLPDAEEYALTTSFRFGPNIAKAATDLIQQYKVPPEKRSIKGCNLTTEDIIGPVNKNVQYAYISRTNGSLFTMAARSCKEKRLCLVKEFEAIFQDLRNVHYLYRGNLIQINNPYIRHFENYQTLKGFANDTDDKELKSACRIVEQYKDNFLEIYDQIQRNAAVNTQEKAEVILSTAHTSKGLEFNQVMLADDFIELKEIKPKNLSKPETQEEINILYVAMTRAIAVLQLPKDLQLAGVTPEKNEVFEELPPVAAGDPLYGLVSQFVRSASDTKRKIKYISKDPVINFDVEMHRVSGQIAYMTMLAYGQEVGFGVYPAIYIYPEQQKLFVVFGQSNATPPITWEREFAGNNQPKKISELFECAEVESITNQYPNFNYLNNYNVAKFDLQQAQTSEKTIADIVDALQQVIKQYGELMANSFEYAKIHQTLAPGVKVRSKSEVIIANMLYERKIPFCYEESLLDSEGGNYLPDFTIRLNGKTWYWEHLGMLEIKDYREHWEEKQAWYEKHFPGQLVITEESTNLSVDANRVIVGFIGSNTQ